MFFDRRSTQSRTSDCHRSLLSCWLCTFRRCSWNESQRTADLALQRISIDAHVGYRKCDFEEMIWHFIGIVETYPYFQGIPQLNMIFCLSSIEPSLVSIEFSVHFATGLHWGLRQLPAGLDLESDQWTHSEISRNPETICLCFGSCWTQSRCKSYLVLMWFDAQEVGQALEELSKAGCQAIFERPGLSRTLIRMNRSMSSMSRVYTCLKYLPVRKWKRNSKKHIRTEQSWQFLCMRGVQTSLVT